MAKLSIILPLTGNLKRLEDTLVSVLENRPERSQVIVVLNQPYDDPYELEGEVDFVQAPHGAGLVDCFDWGVAASKAPIVHLIAAGVEATPGWTDAALQHFADPQVVAVAPLLIDRDNPERILSAGLCFTPAGAIRRIGRGQRADRFAADAGALCGPDLLAAFYRKEAVESVEALSHGGSELAAGVDLAMALRHAGYDCVHEPACVATAAGDLFAASNAWREGVASERLFRRWASVPAMDDWKRSWAAHVALIAAECIQCPIRPSMIARVAGRVRGSLGFSSLAAARFGRQSLGMNSDAVIRPPHFGAADSRGSLHSRAAG